jgi:hypothetical protein
MLSLIVIIIARLSLLAVILRRSQKSHAVVTTPRLPAPPIGSRVTFRKRICAEGRTLPSAPAKGEPVLVKRLVDLQERCSGNFGYMAVAHLAFSLCLLLVLSGQNFFAPHPPVTLSRKRSSSPVPPGGATGSWVVCLYLSIRPILFSRAPYCFRAPRGIAIR